MKVLISTDGVCDIPHSLIENLNIKFLPVPIMLGDEVVNSTEIDNEFIFNFVEKNKTLPKTSAINEFTYAEFFKEELKEYDEILHLPISSKMSLCYDNATKAAEKLENVFVLDTLSLTSGIALLVMAAAKLRDEGKSAKEIAAYLDGMKHNLQVSFVIENLDYLHKGGRCSGLQRFGANLLKIHPSIKGERGKLVVDGKYKGKMEDVVKNYITDTLKTYSNYENETVFITYSSATEKMLESAETTLKEVGNFKNIYRVLASATITSHCGQNTLGIIYLKK